MPTYSYVGINAAGKSVKGKLSASNELDLEDRLHQLGLDVVEYKIIKKSQASIFSRIKIRDLIMFCIHLEQLEKAGVPLLDSLMDLRDSTDSPLFRDLLADVYENVKGGDVLSEALAKRKDVFDDVFVGLIAAGEKTGNLANSFKHLGQHLKWTSELRRKVKKSIRYPIALLLMMTGVITLMMLHVVPQLTEFMTNQGFDLPFHTRALIAVSGAFVDYWFLIFGIPLAGIVTLWLLYRGSEDIRFRIDSFLLKVPFIGPVSLKMNLSRFSHFFGITFSSGIGVLECLETSQKVVSNLVIKEAITVISQSVSDGSSLTAAIAATQRFPSLVVRMFKVGEDSGDMDHALENINYFYDMEVNDSVDAMIGMIQPLLTIVMGALMFWVVAAVFGPLYESFSKMQF